MRISKYLDDISSWPQLLNIKLQYRILLSKADQSLNIANVFALKYNIQNLDEMKLEEITENTFGTTHAENTLTKSQW